MPYISPNNFNINAIINNLLKEIGSPIQELGGVCHGLVLMWIQAKLSGKLEEDWFFERLNYIVTHSALLTEKIKLINSDRLPKNDPLYQRVSQDILPFLNGIVLYQEPDVLNMFYGPLSDSLDAQHITIEKTAHLVTNEPGKRELFRKEGDFPFRSESTFYSYFSDLEKEIRDIYKTQHTRQKDIPLAIKINAFYHAVALSYLPASDQWLLFDANQAPYRIIKPENLSHALFETLVAGRDIGSMPLSLPIRVDLYTTKNFFEKNKNMINDICDIQQKLKAVHLPTLAQSLSSHILPNDKRLEKSDDKTVFLDTVKAKNINVIYAMLKKNNLPILRKIRDAQGNGIFHYAVHWNDEKLLDQLMNTIELFNTRSFSVRREQLCSANNSGQSPLKSILHSEKNLPSILFLLKNGAEIEKQEIFHDVAVWSQHALEKLMREMLHLYPSIFPKCLSEKNADGKTPEDIAASHDKKRSLINIYNHIKSEQSRQEIDNNSTPDKRALLFIAAKKGDIEAMHALLKQDASLFQAIDDEENNILHYALTWRDKKHLEKFVDKIASLNPSIFPKLLKQENALGHHPLKSILHAEDQLESITFLIKSGAPIDGIFHYIASWSKSSLEKVMQEIIRIHPKIFPDCFHEKNDAEETPQDIATLYHGEISLTEMYDRLKKDQNRQKTYQNLASHQIVPPQATPLKAAASAPLALKPTIARKPPIIAKKPSTFARPTTPLQKPGIILPEPKATLPLGSIIARETTQATPMPAKRTRPTPAVRTTRPQKPGVILPAPKETLRSGSIIVNEPPKPAERKIFLSKSSQDIKMTQPVNQHNQTNIKKSKFPDFNEKEEKKRENIVTKPIVSPTRKISSALFDRINKFSQSNNVKNLPPVNKNGNPNIHK